MVILDPGHVRESGADRARGLRTDAPHRPSPRVLLPRGARASGVPGGCPALGSPCGREPPCGPRAVRGQSLRTVAGMVGVIAAVLAGATAGLVAIAASSQ